MIAFTPPSRMNIKIERFYEGENSIIGELYINKKLFCYSLENPWLDNKTFISSIPEGKYSCKQYSSKKYPNVVEILDVKGRTKILIHAGNYAKDTQGCVLLGDSFCKSKEAIWNSKKTIKKFFKKVGYEFEIEITNNFKEVKEKLNLNESNFLINKERKKMKISIWKKTLLAVAPTIATALGGPLAGTAIKQLSKSLLNREDGTEEELANIIESATPGELLKIKELESNFKLEMKKLEVDFVKINAGDRDSARKREIELKDKTPAILGGFIMLGFFTILGFLLFYEIPTKNDAIFNIMLGALGAMATGVVTYYFGSSAGSRIKDLKSK